MNGRELPALMGGVPFERVEIPANKTITQFSLGRKMESIDTLFCRVLRSVKQSSVGGDGCWECRHTYGVGNRAKENVLRCSAWRCRCCCP